jgi:predicted ribosome quality control (RQC) complex YloA/Tae2 family protein
VSNAIRYDSLLVRELARALHDAFAGARLDGVWFDRDTLRVTIATRPWRRGGDAPSLLWQLHPTSGHLTPSPGEPPGVRLQLPAPARVARVTAPPDERVVIFELDAPSDAPVSLPRRLVVELITNMWTAVAVDGDYRITAALRERQTRDRALRAGVAYALPRPSGRPGAAAPLPLATWLEELGAVPPGERLAALPRLAAYASPQNAAWIVGDADVADDSGALERAWQRYTALVHGGPLTPVLRQERETWQPYVAVAADAGAVVHATVLDAFHDAAQRAAAAPAGGVAVEDALAAVARRLEAVQKRVRRLQQEQAGAADEAVRLRMHADVLLSNLHLLKRGSDSARLTDFAGEPLVIDLDPALAPAENAARLYDTARRRERAAARIPALVMQAETELHRLDGLAGRIRDGTASAEELARLQRQQPATGRDAPPPLPYREYRTSRGLEVRVGRGSRSNDDLTFRHSSPSDIWLHARDAAGAHVILRWPHSDSNPPAADIAEAAVLAALYSRARTSGTVPVDWTRRKHVRKPRRAAPGLVIPERVRTVFVEPDQAMEERLRVV